jgi:hypothetical protein
VIGQRIEVLTDLHRVRIFNAGRVVGDHQRAWARHQTLTDPAHLAAAKAFRRDRVTVVRTGPATEVAVRHLGDYDRALGLDTIEGGVA